MLRLLVVSLQGVFLEANIDFIKFSGPAGQVGILKDHAPFIASVLQGVIEYQQHEKKHQFFTLGGIVEVRNNHVVILADRCSETPLSHKKNALSQNPMAQDRQKKKSFHDLYSELSRYFIDLQSIKGAGDRLK